MQIEKEKEIFFKLHGYKLDLDNPKTYNEKICHKKLFDRNPLIVLTADKFKARDYIRQRIGEEAEKHFVPLLWVTDNPEEIPFNDLPEDYVIKPNNGAGWWMICQGRRTLIDNYFKITYGMTPEDKIAVCKRWLSEDYSIRWNEWAYSQIEPLILVEKFLKSETYELPRDYRLCMFGGKLKLFYVTNFDNSTFNYYDENFNLIEFKFKPVDIDVKRLPEFDLMIEFAEKLSSGWDFLRVDFYHIGSEIYFGELTHYPGAGHTPFPYELDLKLGSYWRLND
jgi:hypothetical protein